MVAKPLTRLPAVRGGFFMTREEKQTYNTGLAFMGYLFQENMEKIVRYFENAPYDYDDRKTGWCIFIDELVEKTQYKIKKRS